ncbi:F0F1 ATP synthase subunit A [Tissierella sp. MB52-C2]|uniref:F0F1 ATP synthase subunit A n=1 Tax=Tissierella sp. MB52-C2 TaxID=3070999 RepID=UPI00280AF36B|nr:F0F1 ATP synthase subunit A [Tissierella sp. MB52-C2]WMM24242.1 F0F1 ATP synthase subunit A [Tissierella sp. MB52-C2]
MELGINIFGNEIIVPDTIVDMWIVTILLIIFAFIVNRKIKKANANEVPSNFLNVVEILVESVENLVRSTMGPQNMKFAPYILTLALFLAVANLFGLIGLSPPTSDYSVTLSLALITFVLTQYWSFKNSGGIGGYLKGFTEPMFFLTPLNVIGEIANPISLSFRLFGNIMSGGIIMGLLYQALGIIAPVIAAPLHAYFDVFSGLLQTFIFIMLSMIFIGGAAEE